MGMLSLPFPGPGLQGEGPTQRVGGARLATGATGDAHGSHGDTERVWVLMPGLRLLHPALPEAYTYLLIFPFHELRLAKFLLVQIILAVATCKTVLT